MQKFRNTQTLAILTKTLLRKSCHYFRKYCTDFEMQFTFSVEFLSNVAYVPNLLFKATL